MKKTDNLTEMVFILDKSGSMAPLEADTIGGFNSLIKKQKKEKGECFVSTVLFNGNSQVLHDRVRLKDVKELTNNDYTAYGCTALIDALGGAIHHIKNIHKYARVEDRPAHTVFVIITDGMENASHRYSSDDVKKMIEYEKSEYGWEFMFIGANIDAVETAKHYGIAPEMAVDYRADSRGTEVVYDAICAPLSAMRETGSIKSDWSDKIKKDFKKRR